MPQVTVSNLVKNYGSVQAVANVTFEAETGKILTVLGPSGSGKTTLLRCIAGLEIPDSGDIRIGGAVVFSSVDRKFVPPEKRQVGMVFQSYAIWPNMTVYDNVAFPLEVRKKPQREISYRVREVLSLVKLEGLENRLGVHLSAGQQQRVALARAIVFDPSLLLLDEPLSNLDGKLREYMRVELKELQRQLGITTVYVTHDHAEAFALSHKMLVIHEGERVAYGTPNELWESPPSLFVADFLGHSNILPARVIENLQDGIAKVETPLGTLKLRIFPTIRDGDHLHICLRGRMISIRRTKPQANVNVAKAVLKAIVYRGGDNFDYVVTVNGSTINIHGKIMSHEPLSEGEEVYLEIPVDACTAIPSS